MAVLAGIYGNCEPEYIGCVLDTYERNGYDDSDWYAICWDECEGKVVEVNYDTTRAAGGGWAKIDATEETLRKAYRYYFDLCRLEFDKRWNELQAKDVKVGDDLQVIRGRKVPKGTVGKCFWKGTRYNQYSFKYEERVGLDIDGDRVFLPAEYVEVIGWQSRLIKGKERKRRIRSKALRQMPRWAVNVLVRN